MTLVDVRTEVRREHYADALLILIRAGEIIRGEGQAAMDALGLTMGDMSAARTRADREAKGLNHPIILASTETPAPEPPGARSAPPTPSPPKAQTYHPHASRKRVVREDGFLRCPRHNDGAGEWLPPGDFALRTDHQTPDSDGHRRSWCKECTAAYQAERYLSVRAASNLADDGRVLLTYLHEPDDPQVSCWKCRQPILPNQAVVVLAKPAHQKCPRT